ncbi:MAG: transketolase C-terminal domain-containing protein [Coriobacteriia bacterium]|nr:transketolase C-terminal domain-containing protein [Coriobacteriia bacterium]
MADKKATREALGATLVEMVAEGRDDIVVLDADLAKATTTVKFAAAYPERFFDVGIAEQNLIGTAAGLAAAGRTAFASTFAVFATGRAYDQIRNSVCYANLSVKIAATHAGVTVGPDGGSHQMVEDIALMRVLPNMRVLVPADIVSAKAALRLAASTPGPFYIRLGRPAVSVLYADDATFELGRAIVLREGSDVTIAACGHTVEQALAAADELATAGVSAEVIDVFSIKPLDSATLLASAAKTGAVVTCEEHSVIGGLGEAVAALLSENAPAPLERVGVKDVFGTSGEAPELMAYFGLAAADIAAAAGRAIARK